MCLMTDSKPKTEIAILEAGFEVFSANAVPIEADADLAARYAADQQETLKTVVAGQKEGGFDPNIPPEWIVQAYQHLIYAGWTMVAQGEATPKQAAKLAWTTLTKGMSA